VSVLPLVEALPVRAEPDLLNAIPKLSDLKGLRRITFLSELNAV